MKLALITGEITFTMQINSLSQPCKEMLPERTKLVRILLAALLLLAPKPQLLQQKQQEQSRAQAEHLAKAKWNQSYSSDQPVIN